MSIKFRCILPKLVQVKPSLVRKNPLSYEVVIGGHQSLVVGTCLTQGMQNRLEDARTIHAPLLQVGMVN